VIAVTTKVSLSAPSYVGTGLLFAVTATVTASARTSPSPRGSADRHRAVALIVTVR
jgi:hypothetical protein